MVPLCHSFSVSFPIPRKYICNTDTDSMMMFLNGHFIELTVA